jgi:hypothetical protein
LKAKREGTCQKLLITSGIPSEMPYPKRLRKEVGREFQPAEIPLFRSLNCKTH